MTAFGVLLDIDCRHVEHLTHPSEPNEVTPRFVLGEKLGIGQEQVCHGVDRVDLRPRANLGEIFDVAINDWHRYRLSFGSLKLSCLSRFARSGTSDKHFSLRVSVGRSPCPGDTVNELALNMAHVV